jgi:hypothetical protein
MAQFLTCNHGKDELSDAFLLVSEARGLVLRLEHTHGVEPERLLRCYFKAHKRLERRRELYREKMQIEMSRRPQNNF